MGVRRAQDGGVEHARQSQVGDEAPLAGEQAVVF